MKCELKCFFCKKTFEYDISQKHCFNCKHEILDEGIKVLVFAFNMVGIKTKKSCEGHYDFDNGFREGFPWIVFFKDDNIIKIEKLIKEYNYQNNNYSNWRVKWNPKTKENYICPVEDYRALDFLIEGSKDFAKFILKKSGYF